MFSSKDALIVTNENEYIFDFDLYSSQQNYIYIKLLNAVIPVSWYNVNENNNTLIVILNSIQTYTINLRFGNYSGLSLASTIQTTLNISGLSVSFDEITSKITFSYSLPLYISNCSILETIGFSQPTLATFDVISNKYILIGNQPVNLQQISHISIVLPNMSTNSFFLSKSNIDNLLCCIPVNAPPMSNLVYVNQDDLIINTEKNEFRQLHLQITDQQGNNVNLNGIPFYLNFLFKIIRFVE